METNGEVANGYTVTNRKSSSSRDNSSNSSSINGSPGKSLATDVNHQVFEDDENVADSHLCQLGVVHRIPCTEVPLLFREAHVQGGFRPLHRPWWYYPLTALHLHNESMNVWTHALGAGLMLAQFIKFSFTLDFLNDPYTWPLVAGFFCGMSLFTGSAGAHCMQSKSELYHYTVFMIDYAGIGLYGLGSVIVHLEYCSEDSFYNAVSWWFVPAGCVLAFAICFCCSVAKVIYVRPYPFRRKYWQMLPVMSIYVLLISPIVHHVITYYWTAEEEYSPGIVYHNLQITWFILSGLFFASDIPQRFFPGKCDYFFHSHQLFHIAIMLCILYQMEGVFLDFLSRRPVIEARPKPTLTSSFAPVLLTILAEVVSIISFWIYIRRDVLPKSSSQPESQKTK